MFKMFKKVNGALGGAWGCIILLKVRRINKAKYFQSQNRGLLLIYTVYLDVVRALTCYPVCTAREKVVGWYSTGPKLKEADLDINALVSRFTEAPLDPVLVICEVQVRLQSGLLTGLRTPVLFIWHIQGKVQGV